MENTQLTKEEISQKAATLGEREKCPVHAFEFKDPKSGEQIIGYIKEPDRLSKLQYMDRMVMQPMSAGADLLSLLLLREESNSRILDSSTENDIYFLGAVKFATDLVRASVNQYDKKK